MQSTLGLYIHIPFCYSKCPYCDFFSLRGTTEDYTKYVEILKSNIISWSKKINYNIDTIYFGGGTPSLLGADLLCDILNCIKNNFNITENAEITFEVNSNSGKFFDFEKARHYGFNRISIGLQSANENELKLLGRTHSINDVTNTVNLARKANINNISLDLMMGTPEQTMSTLKNSIDFCVNLDVQHISSYILKLEKNTYFYKNQSKYIFPNEDTTSDLYLFTVDYLRKNGFNQYEISNFSKPNYESKHNLKYWNLDNYLGIGPAAHSMIDGKRFYYNNSFEEFKNNVIIDEGIVDYKEEYIMLQLRLAKGINFAEYKNIFGQDIPEDIIKKSKLYEKQGYLTIDDKHIALTPKGFLVSNAIISEFI